MFEEARQICPPSWIIHVLRKIVIVGNYTRISLNQNPHALEETLLVGLKIDLDFSLQVLSEKTRTKKDVNLTWKKWLMWCQQVSNVIHIPQNVSPWSYRLSTSMLDVIILCYKAILVIIIFGPNFGTQQ